MANSNTKIESDKKFADIDDELIKNKRHETLEETKIKVETDEPKLVINLDGEVRSGDESELVNKSGDGDTADEGRSGNQRENRLTSIIDQLRGANKLKGKIFQVIIMELLSTCLTLGAEFRYLCFHNNIRYYETKHSESDSV